MPWNPQSQLGISPPEQSSYRIASDARLMSAVRVMISVTPATQGQGRPLTAATIQDGGSYQVDGGVICTRVAWIVLTRKQRQSRKGGIHGNTHHVPSSVGGSAFALVTTILGAYLCRECFPELRGGGDGERSRRRRGRRRWRRRRRRVHVAHVHVLLVAISCWPEFCYTPPEHVIPDPVGLGGGDGGGAGGGRWGRRGVTDFSDIGQGSINIVPLVDAVLGSD